MTFDVFGDFEERGYLRNVAGLKDLAQVRQLEHRAFLIKVGKALFDLSALTKEVHLPGDGYLDAYLAPFIREPVPPEWLAEGLRTLTTLGSATAG